MFAAGKRSGHGILYMKSGGRIEGRFDVNTCDGAYLERHADGTSEVKFGDNATNHVTGEHGTN